MAQQGPKTKKHTQEEKSVKGVFLRLKGGDHVKEGVKQLLLEMAVTKKDFPTAVRRNYLRRIIRSVFRELEKQVHCGTLGGQKLQCVLQVRITKEFNNPTFLEFKKYIQNYVQSTIL